MPILEDICKWGERWMRKRRNLGCEIAGTIEEIGGNVEKYKPGDAVYGYIGSHSGGYAEYAVTKVDEIAP